MGRFGLCFGEAFQIVDDVLDVTATAEDLGKSPGKDAASSKQTYPRCVGVEESRAAAERAVAEAITALEPFGPEADDLRPWPGMSLLEIIETIEMTSAVGSDRILSPPKEFVRLGRRKRHRWQPGVETPGYDRSPSGRRVHQDAPCSG